MRETLLIHPALHRISKWLPNDPPQRGDIVLVEDLGRCRVIRTPKLEWSGLTWTLRGPIRVRPE